MRQPLLTRRDLIVGVGAGLTTCALQRGTLASARLPMESLAGAAQKAGVSFGASASKELLQNPQYAELYKTHAKILTTDVALKIRFYSLERGAMGF